MKAKRRNAGVALLSVVAIAGITGILAYHIITMQTLTISHSELSLSQESALSYALGVETFVAEKLAEDGAGEAFDAFTDDWNNLEIPFEIPNGSMQLRVVDLMSKFNANSLADPENTVAQQSMERLCAELGFDATLAPKFQDWVDGDTNTLPNGGEDWEYAILDTPFRTANQLAFDITEVSYFAPMYRDATKELEKHITVLPTPTLAVNLNTAPATVLIALLHDPQNAPYIEAFTEEERSFDSVQSASSIVAPFTEIEDYLRVKSDYFELHVTILMGDRTRLDMTSTLYRSPFGGDVTIYKRDLARRHDWNEEEEASLDGLGIYQ